MQADSVYVMGHGHRVCQDYARSGTHPGGLAYGIVSDGCSGSPDTDVGARLLALTVGELLQVYHTRGWLDRVLMDASRVGICARDAKCFVAPTLPMEALDATVLIVASDSLGRARVSCMGDGVIAARDADGFLQMWEVEAPDGFPRYPNYVNSPGRRAAVEAGQEWTVEGPEGEEFRAAEVCAFTREIEDAEVVAVFSDGVRSFVDADRQPVPVAQVVGELMAFRGMAGAFVQRRVQGFLRTAAKRGWRHDDDLAMAAVHVGVP